MLKCSKLLWKIREVLSQLIANKLRFTLTVTGISVGVLLYFLFSTLAYSYLQSTYEKYNSFAEKTLLVTGELSDKEYSRVDDFFAGLPSTVFYVCDNQNVMRFSVNGKTVRALLSLTCTSSPCTSIAVPGADTDIVNRAKISIGRDFDSSDFRDNKKVVIISELAAELLFPSENPVGKNIAFSVGDTGDNTTTDFTVIGVYTNTPSEKKATKRINSSQDSDIQIRLEMYTPVTSLTQSERECFYRLYSVYYSDDVNTLYSRANAFFEGYDYIGIYTKLSHFRALEELNRSVSNFISMAMFIIIIISGISISNSMIFSVRERIPEIGIRKAFGADGCDIVLRFVLEGALTAIVGVLFAVLTAVAILLGIKYYTNTLPSPILTIHYSWTILAKTICFAVLEGVMGSIIPAAYAARIQIADAVRFD